MKITFCIPSKNNLRYLKSSINSIKTNSSIEHDIIVYVDADNDGTEEWLIENNVTYLKNVDDKPKGIAFAYNRCIEAAKTHIVCMFHADMFMARGFDTAILKHLKPLTVVSATRIEPPLHPAGMEKIVKDFGMYPEDFQHTEFEEFAQKTSFYNKDSTTKGIVAPWAIYKEDITCIGMHEECFHSYHEDSDIFNRFVLNGYSLVQTWEAFVYHFTCRGGQFQDGVDQITTDEDFHRMKANAARNYIRKWGCWIQNDEYHYPTVLGKYQTAFVVHNCNLSLLEMLEPWCDRIYVDERFEIGRAHDYIEMERSRTIFDIDKRVLIKDHNDPIGENNVIVEFDGSKLTNSSMQLITQLSQILDTMYELGTFEYDMFKITINSLQKQDMIKPFFKNVF